MRSPGGQHQYYNQWAIYGPYEFRWAGQIKYQWTWTEAFYGGAAR